MKLKDLPKAPPRWQRSPILSPGPLTWSVLSPPHQLPLWTCQIGLYPTLKRGPSFDCKNSTSKNLPQKTEMKTESSPRRCALLRYLTEKQLEPS